jgi:hypothetical protein
MQSVFMQAEETLQRVRKLILAKQVLATTPQARGLFLEACEAAQVRMSHRAGVLYALSLVAEVAGDTSEKDGLAEFAFEGMDDPREDLRVVAAARILGLGYHFREETSEDSARACLTTHGLTPSQCHAKVIRLPLRAPE